MTSLNCLRASHFGTQDFEETIRQYAALAITREIRLCVTPRYIDASDLPYQDFTLLQNSPLLLATVIVELPGITEPHAIVLDSPGMNMRNEERAKEVKALVEHLVQAAAGKVFYGVQQTVPTARLAAEQAAGTIMASDYAALTAASAGDLYRLMGGISIDGA